MSLASDPLPTDLDALRAFAETLQAELARRDIEIVAHAAEIHAKTLHIEKLKMQLAKLRRARFGQSSEKLDHDIEQLELLIGDLEEDASEGEARAKAVVTALHGRTGTAERRHQRRKPLPEHLPREVITHNPVRVCPGCGGTVFSRIGQDERDVLEYVPSSFKVIQHLRPKLSCRSCETIVQALMPALPIERGRPGPGLITHVVVSKFCDHIPLHRQVGISLRQGVELDRSTLADWVGQALFLLAPLAEAIGRHVRAGVALHADDTTVPVLSSGLGKTKKGCLWVAVRDERPWGSDVPPAAFYRYWEDRKGIHVEALLGAYRGFLHADGYGGFTRFYKPTTPLGDAPLVEVACWSRARRHFYDVHHQTASPIALEALHQIAALFAVESHIRGKPPDQRTATRREHTQPLLERLKQFLEIELLRVSGKSSLAAAIRYTLSRWMSLTRYVTDGRLEISIKGLGIDAVHLAGFDDRVHAGGTLSACIRAAEEVVFPAEEPTPSERLPTIPSRRSTNCCPGVGNHSLLPDLLLKPLRPRPSADAYRQSAYLRSCSTPCPFAVVALPMRDASADLALELTGDRLLCEHLGRLKHEPEPLRQNRSPALSRPSRSS